MNNCNLIFIKLVDINLKYKCSNPVIYSINPISIHQLLLLYLTMKYI